MDRPPPPPEAVLLRRVREAAKIPLTTAARRAGMSKARWAQIEQGGARRRGAWERATAPDGTLAHMAAAVGLPADRLETEGQRPDAAAVLREMQRDSHGALQSVPDSAPADTASEIDQGIQAIRDLPSARDVPWGWTDEDKEAMIAQALGRRALREAREREERDTA